MAVAHGADSHVDDDLGGQCDTWEWLAASRLVYERINAWSAALGRPMPVVLALFGGYRGDSPESVLELHVADCATAIATLGGADVSHTPRVVRKRRPSWMDLQATISDAVRAEIAGLRVREVGFRAGPSFIAGDTVKFMPPAPIEHALVFLEKYAGCMRRGHIALEDGSILWFDPSGFQRRDVGRAAPPPAGVVVETMG